MQVSIWNVPFPRRRQTFAAFIHTFQVWWLIGLNIVCICIPLLWIPYIAYLTWCFWDRSACCTGGRRVPWMRSLFLWEWLRDFFPAELRATVPLDPKNNYLFGLHPHGIIATSAWINFGTDATGFSRIFPGITCHLLTLYQNFYIPFFRDFLLSLGFGSVSRESCVNKLTNLGPGTSIAIVPGGAAEALDARPGVFDLTLKKRMGFVKVALQCGAHLVPVCLFGENDLYDQLPNPDGSTLRKIQAKLQSACGFSMPIFHGRGIFLLNWGILPRRIRLVTIVGKPVACPKIANPSNEDVQSWHDKYVAALTELYEANRKEFDPSNSNGLRLLA